MPDNPPTEKKQIQIPRLTERRGHLRAFISPSILTRLEEGQFQPVRQSNQATKDIRDSQSPLALTKRCIRYQPAVFRDRHTELLNIAHYLNQPYSKVLTLVGKQGVGKLSLLRAVAELLDPRYAELLWFEVPSYGDSVELALLMLKQLCQLAERRSLQASTEEQIPPSLWEAYTVEARQRLFDVLRPRLNALNATPTLIVVNGLDAMLNGHNKALQAPALVEVLNYLITFDSFKIALAGERHCVDLLDVTPQGLKMMKIEGLALSNELLSTMPEDLADFAQVAQDMPWFWQAVMNIDKRSPQTMQAILDGGHLLKSERAKSSLQASDWLQIITFLTHRHLEAYGGEALSLLALLSVMRQPLSLKTLAHITQTDLETLTIPMKQGVFKALMRFTVNPHTLALSVNKVHTVEAQGTPILDATTTPLLVELYDDIQPYFKALQAVEIQRYWHHRLARFYEDQAKESPKHRLLIASDTLALEREARFHHDAEKALEDASLSVSPRPTQYANAYLPLQNTSKSIAETVSQGSKQSERPQDNTSTKNTSTKGAFSASFPNTAPIEAKPRLPEHERYSVSPSSPQKTNPAPKKEATFEPLARPYKDALLKLAMLYTHLEDLPALEATLHNIAPFQAQLSRNEAAQVELLQVFLESRQGKRQAAFKHLETLLEKLEDPHYSEDLRLSALLRLNELHQADASMIQNQQVQAFLKHYFTKDASFLTWKAKPSQPEVLSNELKTERVLWAKGLTMHSQASDLPPPQEIQAWHLSVRAYVEASAFPEAVEGLHQLAKRHLKAAQADKALLYLERAETLDALHSQKVLKWTTQRDLALVLWELGHPQEAVKRLDAVLHDAEAEKESYWQACTLFLLGELAFDSLNGVEWALNCMEKALAFGEDVLGSQRYTAFSQRRKQLHDERHNTDPLKHNPNSSQRLEWKRRSSRKLSS